MPVDLAASVAVLQNDRILLIKRADFAVWGLPSGQVDLQAVKALVGGTYIAFASQEIAERLAGSVAGTILPLSFHPELELMVDPALLEHDELYFNAARLDRSIVLKADDYVAVAQPRLERIAAGL